MLGKAQAILAPLHHKQQYVYLQETAHHQWSLSSYLLGLKFSNIKKNQQIN